MARVQMEVLAVRRSLRRCRTLGVVPDMYLVKGANRRPRDARSILTIDDRSEAFRRMFDGHARSILAYALRRTDGPGDAADVVAETFVVAWRRMDAVPAGGEARPWLFGVARRVLANQRRSTRRRSALAGRLREVLVDRVTEDHSDRVARTHLVRTALERLGEDDREVLHLTAWEGLTPTEIARVLDMPPSTIRGRLHRARERFRQAISDLQQAPDASATGHRSHEHRRHDGPALAIDTELNP